MTFQKYRLQLDDFFSVFCWEVFIWIFCNSFFSRVALLWRHWVSKEGACFQVIYEQEKSLEGVQDGEYVIRGQTHSSEAEEGETPGDSQHTAEAQDGGDVRGGSSWALHLSSLVKLAQLQHGEPSQHHNEGAEGEDEDEAVITDVHIVVDIRV